MQIVAACSGLLPARPAAARTCLPRHKDALGRGRRRRTHSSPIMRAAASSSNLGVLESLAAPDPQQDFAFFVEQQQQAAASTQFSGGGVINVDGPAITASLLVLLMLLALSLNRILGLERLFGKWLLAMQEQREEERRDEVNAARQSLEQQFEPGQGDAGSGEGPTKGPSPGKGKPGGL